MDKLQTSCGLERVIFVGENGMIKSAQIEEIKSENYYWNYLTSIANEQIKTMINKDIIQLKSQEHLQFIIERLGVKLM